MFNSQDYLELKKQFDEYYQNKILPDLVKSEGIRKLYLRMFLIISMLVLIWFAVVIYNQFTPGESIIDAILSKLEIINVVIVLTVCIPLYLYNKITKMNILSNIANFFGEFEYAHNQSNTMLIKNMTLSEKSDKIEIDDAFTGKYLDVPVEIIEYKKFNLREIRSQGMVREEYVKNGMALLFVAQMNKNFKGKTIVTKDRGILNKITKYKNLQRVSLEDVLFEKKYEIYSDDQIEARYILTTSMMERMIKLSEIFSKIEYNFFDNKVYININTKKNLFECNSFFRTLINYKRIKKSFDELYLIFSIIKIIKLNEKQIL
jgi:hypothetical protein